MSIKLSIIIPCYNVAKFIPSCFKHLRQIPLNSTEFEIICYDDCSTDDTLNILKEESLQQSNLKILHGTTNIGPGGGRNYALKHAIGEYVWFVDADDIILPEIVLRALGVCANETMDVIPFNYKEIDINDNIITEHVVFNDSTIMNGLDFVETIFKTGIVFHMGYPWRFIVRRDFLLQNNIIFPEGIRYGEDTVWMPQILLLAQKVAGVSTFGYMYRHHNQSTCGMFSDSYPGRIIYERCITTSSLLLHFASQIVSEIHDERIEKYAQAFRQTVKHRYVGQLPIYLGRASFKERNVFFEYLNINEYNDVIPYTPFLSRLLLYPIIGRIVAEIIALMYKLKH